MTPPFDDHFARVLDAAPIGMGICDEVSRFTHANNAFLEMLGYATHELLELTLCDVVHPDECTACSSLCDEIRGGQAELRRAQWRFVAKSGAEKWGNVSLHASRNDVGRLLFMTVIVQDITEGKRVEDELIQSEKKYRELTEALPQAIYETDEQGHITYANAHGFEMFGYAPGETDITTFHITDLIVPEQRQLAELQFGRLFQGEPARFAEYTLIRSDGSTFPAIAHAGPKVEGGRVVGARGVLVDITDRKRAEDEKRRLVEQLRQSEKMEAVGQLAGGIAHDFNNQLIAILGYADLIKRKFEHNELLSRYVDGIIVGAQRASDLTGQLLAFSRKSRHKAIPLDVHDIIAETISLLEHSLDKKISIAQRLAAPSPLVFGDPTQIQNALLNLAINARDAMPEGGEILFTTETTSLDDQACSAVSPDLCAGAYLKICVIDDGVGMAPATQKRIFEPFYTTKEQSAGTGMGLATAYGTIGSHGGAIRVRSREGEGSTFEIYLPLADESARPERVRPSQEPPPATQARVLVVDDEVVARDVVSDMLHSLGHEPIVCASGAEAVEYFGSASCEVDVVLLDMIMPHMSGKQTFRALREIDPDVVVLLCTGHSKEGDVARTLNEGARGFVQKPFSLAQLSAEIDRVLEQTDSGLRQTSGRGV